MTSFLDFWMAYPKRKGSNPRALAEKKYLLAIKKGADPQHILSSVQRYKNELTEQNLIDTPYVCQASTWLGQQRYLDYAPDDGQQAAKINEDMMRRGYIWQNERWTKV